MRLLLAEDEKELSTAVALFLMRRVMRRISYPTAYRLLRQRKETVTIVWYLIL